MEPYGSGNRPPMLCMKDVRIESADSIGGGRHTKLVVSKFGERYECVFFSRTLRDLNIREGDVVDLAFGPKVNEFRGKRSVQLLLSDLCNASDSR